MRINKFTSSLILESIKIGDYIDAGLIPAKFLILKRKTTLMKCITISNCTETIKQFSSSNDNIIAIKSITI